MDCVWFTDQNPEGDMMFEVSDHQDNNIGKNQLCLFYELDGCFASINYMLIRFKSV